MLIIEKEINAFVESISDLWNEEALDGDVTEEIAKMVLRELDARNGNR